MYTLLHLLMMIGSMLVKNIVIFGQTGAGKSSVVNLMAGKEQAVTSPDMQRCTTHWAEYSIACDGYNYKVFDTVGLQEQQKKPCEEHPDAIEDTRSLITKLDNEGGIDLLLFCMRGLKSIPTIKSNYRRFYTELLSGEKKRIPIVLVVTGLEGEQNMEDWWTRNEDTLKPIVVDGHVCITAAKNLDQGLYKQSRKLISKLVKEHTQISLPNFEQGTNNSYTHTLYCANNCP
jgi:tRNA U34 5-carboxymethylaminomethyl modifying GTPase MnmE/TrmE